MFIWYFNMSIKFRVSCRFFYAHDFSFTFRFGSNLAFFKARELVRVDFVIPKCLRNGSEKSNLEPLAVYLACAWNFRDWKTIDFISFPDFIFFFFIPRAFCRCQHFSRLVSFSLLWSKLNWKAEQREMVFFFSSKIVPYCR